VSTYRMIMLPFCFIHYPKTTLFMSYPKYSVIRIN